MLPAIEYDHFVHTAGIFLGTLVVWTNFVRQEPDDIGRRDALVVSLLAGLGLGAINETVEFLLTIAQSGTHIGGYTNTGWDLVSNVVGAGLATAYLRRQRCGDRIS